MNRTILTLIAIGLFMAGVPVVADESQGKNGLPPLPPYQMRAEVPEADRLKTTINGAVLFSNRCGYCHLAMGMGTNVLTAKRAGMGLPPESGLLTNRTDLTAEFINTVVRNGIGYMPRLTRVDVTDSELAKIATYLVEGN